ncbi:MAG: EF-hand domain-containing protein [Kiritimatiellae bacterium]|nr:EF-hand domain-containing protein [Kiritimatiellia bacterium]
MKTWMVGVAGLASLLAVAVLAQEGGTPPAPPAPGGPRQGAPGFGAMRDAMTFEKMDADKDGKVTLDEYLAAWTEVGKARFKTIDANGDGVVTKEEMDKAREGFRRGFRGEGGTGDRPGAPRGPRDGQVPGRGPRD